MATTHRVYPNGTAAIGRQMTAMVGGERSAAGEIRVLMKTSRSPGPSV